MRTERHLELRRTLRWLASVARAMAATGLVACVPPAEPSAPSSEPPRVDESATADAPPPPAPAVPVEPEIAPPPPEATPQRAASKPKVYPFNESVPPPEQLMKGLAARYANLSPGECKRLLKSAAVPTKPYRRPAKGVATPLILAGSVGDVTFAVAPPSSPYGVFDCRMALTMAELVKVLARHDVVGVRVDNFYRPQARLPGKRKPSQHRHGLAMDVVSFRLKDGRTLDVERDYEGALGAASCGPDAKLAEERDEAIRLRNLLCDVARQGLFHHILTPNYDAAHRNHFHLDIKRDNRWYSVN